MTSEHWWQGHRGEYYVAVQIVLFLIVLYGPRTLDFLPAWNAGVMPGARWVGLVSLLAGGALVLMGAFRLGKNLTPLPRPKERSQLIQTGPYALVRHPIYSGVIFMGWGWAFWVHGWLTLAYAFLLLIFFDIKSRREERWLLGKYAEYAGYRRRVRKLIPFIY